MEYMMVNDYQIPALTLNEPPMPEIGKYGSMRRKFLRENAPMLFDEMLMSGTLYPHLVEIDKRVYRQVEQSMAMLAKMKVSPDRKTDPLGWAQWMNSLKDQAEEMALPMIYSL